MNFISKETYALVHDDPRIQHIFNELFEESKENGLAFRSTRSEEDVFHLFTETREYLAGVCPDWNPMPVKAYGLGCWVDKCINNRSHQYEKHAGFLYKKQTQRFYSLDNFEDVTDSLLPLAEETVKLRATMIDNPWLQKVIIQGLNSVHCNTFNRDNFCHFIWLLYK